MATRWRGLLAPLGITTGDGRRFATDAVTWRELPLPLKWQRNDDAGHDDSVIIGSVDEIRIGTVAEALSNDWTTKDAVSTMSFPKDTLGVWGTGELFDDVDPAVLPRLAEDVAEAKLLTQRQVIGPSVDAGAADAILAEPGSEEPITEERWDEIMEEAWETGTEPDIEVLFTKYEVAAATLVNIPAFGQCLAFTLDTVDDDEEAAALVASVHATGWASYPLAARETPWNAREALARLAGHFTLDDADTANWDGFAAGFLWRNDDANPQTRGAYGYGLVDVVDGKLSIVPKAVFTAAKSLEDGGGSKCSATEQTRMREVLSAIYARMAKEFEDTELSVPWTASVTAAVQARTELAVSLLAAAPPLDISLFADPELPAITPVTITDPDENGVRRVFGHAAAFGVCHAGIRDVCTTAPTSDQQYAPFHRYLTLASGEDLPVPVGRITVAHGQLTGKCRCCPGIDDHACNRLSLGAAVAHYDQARTVAYVRAGEDRFGIWFAGIVAPDATAQDIAALGRQKVSGDWRENAGSLELVEVLTLNREKPGFPLPRATMTNGRQVSLVAAGAVSATRTGPRPLPTGRPGNAGPVIDYDKMAAAMTTAFAAVLPPGVTLAYDTTPVREPVAEIVPDDGPVVVDFAAQAAALAAEVDGTVHALAAAALVATLEGLTADV